MADGGAHGNQSRGVGERLSRAGHTGYACPPSPWELAVRDEPSSLCLGPESLSPVHLVGGGLVLTEL